MIISLELHLFNSLISISKRVYINYVFPFFNSFLFRNFDTKIKIGNYKKKNKGYFWNIKNIQNKNINF